MVSDDIVTRLRAFIPLADYMGDDLHAEDLRQAADEIEQLRAQLSQWKALATMGHNQLVLGTFDPMNFIAGYAYLAAGGK